jgi:hypothetical protein
VTTSHALNLAGGTDRSTFSGGVGYQYQDGVIGNFTKSDYRRFTIRLNSEHVVYRDSKGLDVVKIGENFYFSHKQNQGIQIGNQYNNAISDMLRANPVSHSTTRTAISSTGPTSRLRAQRAGTNTTPTRSTPSTT